MTKRKAQVKLAFDGVGKRDRKVVVTLARFKWKQAHSGVTEHMIRMVRFLWMRDAVLWSSCDRLHAATLGRCLRAGLVEHRENMLVVTNDGQRLLDTDRAQYAEAVH